VVGTFLFVSASLFLGSCDDDDPAPNPPTPAPLKSIAEIASADPNLSTLVKALKKAGLDKTLTDAGTYTVFAPTNQAFTDEFGAGFPDNSIYTKEVITPILLNHVLSMKKNSTSLVTGYVNTLSEGPGKAPLSLYVDLVKTAGKVTLNGKAEVLSANIEASNGIIHTVNKVITLPTIVDAAIANPAFKTLVTILTSTTGTYGDQSAVLAALSTATTAAPFTVFAPTDAAFSSATATGGWANGATGSTLSNVLKYHVIATGNKQAKDLMNNDVLTSFLTQTLKVVKTTTDVKIEDSVGDRSTVQVADVQCINGVVHAISAVLRPSLAQ
jgi:uncharacterized surface protein with fasciclin (FAS1) repeats